MPENPLRFFHLYMVMTLKVDETLYRKPAVKAGFFVPEKRGKKHEIPMITSCKKGFIQS